MILYAFGEMIFEKCLQKKKKKKLKNVESFFVIYGLFFH